MKNYCDVFKTCFNQGTEFCNECKENKQLKSYYTLVNKIECSHLHTEETHPYGWVACKDCGKLLT